MNIDTSTAPLAPPADTSVTAGAPTINSAAPAAPTISATPPKRRRTKPAAEPAPLPRAPAPAPTTAKAPAGKLGILAALLHRPEGATLAAMVEATDWQPHSVRGAMAGALKKKFALTITSEKVDGSRVYRSSADGARS